MRTSSTAPAIAAPPTRRAGVVFAVSHHPSSIGARSANEKLESSPAQVVASQAAAPTALGRWRSRSIAAADRHTHNISSM